MNPETAKARLSASTRGTHLSIKELEEIGEALSCIYIYMAGGNDGARGYMHFLKEGRFSGFSEFNMGQLEGFDENGYATEWGRVARPDQVCIEADVKYFCGVCNEPIVEWFKGIEDKRKVVGARCNGKVSGESLNCHSCLSKEIQVQIVSFKESEMVKEEGKKKGFTVHYRRWGLVSGSTRDWGNFPECDRYSDGHSWKIENGVLVVSKETIIFEGTERESIKKKLVAAYKEWDKVVPE